jgi:hypothetical protein
MTDTREYEDAPADARMECEAVGGRLIYRLFPGGDEPRIVVSLGYGDCEWMLAAHAAAKKGQDFKRVLSQGAVVESGGKLLFASAIADGKERGWGLEIAAPFGIAGWSLLHDASDGKGKELLKAVKLAMKQEDAKP